MMSVLSVVDRDRFYKDTLEFLEEELESGAGLDPERCEAMISRIKNALGKESQMSSKVL